MITLEKKYTSEGLKLRLNYRIYIVNGQRVVISKSSFFYAYIVIRNEAAKRFDHIDILVDGKKHWGKGWTWEQVEQRLQEVVPQVTP